MKTNAALFVRPRRSIVIKNTLSYKIGKIREVLGYDILLNENRMKIMISLRILRLDREYYT